VHSFEGEGGIDVRRLVLAVAIVSAALVAAQAAAAAPARVDVSGTYTVTDFGTLACAPGGSLFVFRCTTTGLVSQYSGSFQGTSVSNFEQIIDCKTSRTLGQGTETFTGSVADIGSGTLTWGIRFQSDFDCATFSVSGFLGNGVVTSGTGDLAGLNGRIQFGDVSYEGELH
jgi:hypothetical protein